jgi:hypothetical protein
VTDAALQPGAITGVWKEKASQNSGTEWVAAPGVKAVGGGAWVIAQI